MLDGARTEDLLKSLTQELVFAEALLPVRFKGIVVIHKTSMVTITEAGKLYLIPLIPDVQVPGY